MDAKPLRVGIVGSGGIDAYRADGPFCFQPGFDEGVGVQEILDACALAESGSCWVKLPL